jgi:hypothetical protein
MDGKCLRLLLFGFLVQHFGRVGVSCSEPIPGGILFYLSILCISKLIPVQVSFRLPQESLLYVLKFVWNSRLCYSIKSIDTNQSQNTQNEIR